MLPISHIRVSLGSNVGLGVTRREAVSAAASAAQPQVALSSADSLGPVPLFARQPSGSLLEGSQARQAWASLEQAVRASGLLDVPSQPVNFRESRTGPGEVQILVTEQNGSIGGTSRYWQASLDNGPEPIRNVAAAAARLLGSAPTR